MKECVNCGALLDDSAVVCKYCSYGLDGSEPNHQEPPRETGQRPPSPPGAAPGSGQQQAGYQQPGAAQQPGPSYGTNPGQGYAPQGQPGYGPYRPPHGNQAYGPPPYGQPPYGYSQQGPYPPRYRDVNRIAVGVLAIIFGGIGVHKFMLGRVGVGIIYLLFCWTGIPFIIGVIEGIIYLCTDDETFREKYLRLY